MAARKSSAILVPNLGLYLDRPALAIPTRGLLDGNNFRIRDGALTNRLLGWQRFGEFTLNGPVKLIYDFILADGTDRLIFGTLTDLYVYNPNDESVAFITPTYVTGTAAASGTAVTGTTTTWDADGIKAGDFISFGSATENDPDATWWEIDSVGSDTSITLVLDAGTVVDGPYTIRRTLTTSWADYWDATVFLNADPDNADLFFATNGIDPVLKWDPGDMSAVFLDSLGFTAKSLAVFANMMIYGNIVQGGVNLPSTIINSDVGKPYDVSGGLSEQFVVHNGPEQIVDLQPLGDNLVAYSEKRHITLIQFVGDPLVFSFRQSSEGTGPIGPRMVANFGDYHEFIGADSQYKFDGAALQSVGTQVWKTILRSRDPARNNIGFNHFDEESGELIWVLPLVTDPGADASAEVGPAEAWPEHYLEEVGPQDPTPVSHRDFPFTASGYYTQQGTGDTWATVTSTWEEAITRWNEQFFFAAFPLNVVGDANGKIYLLNTLQTADGTPMASFVHFGRRVLGDARMRGLLARVYPFANSPSGGDIDLNVTLYLSDHASGNATASQIFPFDLTLPEGGHFVSTFRRARFFEVKFGTTTATDPWLLEGYDIDAKIGGRR